MSGKNRNELHHGLTVDILLKKDQKTGILTRGKIERILTNSPYHPHGIKVKLEDGRIGRVKTIIRND